MPFLGIVFGLAFIKTKPKSRRDVKQAFDFTQEEGHFVVGRNYTHGELHLSQVCEA